MTSIDFRPRSGAAPQSPANAAAVTTPSPPAGPAPAPRLDIHRLGAGLIRATARSVASPPDGRVRTGPDPMASALEALQAAMNGAGGARLQDLGALESQLKGLGKPFSPLAGAMSAPDLAQFQRGLVGDSGVTQTLNAMDRLDAKTLPPALQTLYQNLIDVKGLQNNVVDVVAPVAHSQAWINWLGNASQAMASRAPAAGDDTAAYLDQTTEKLLDEFGKAGVALDGMSVDRQNREALYSAVVDNRSGATMSRKTIDYMTSGGLTGLSYQGTAGLTLEQASSRAVTDLLDNAATFMQDAAKGINATHSREMAKKSMETLSTLVGVLAGVAGGIGGVAGIAGGLSKSVSTMSQVKDYADKVNKYGKAAAKQVAELGNRVMSGDAAEGTKVALDFPDGKLADFMKALNGGTLSPQMKASLDKVRAAFNTLSTAIVSNGTDANRINITAGNVGDGTVTRADGKVNADRHFFAVKDQAGKDRWYSIDLHTAPGRTPSGAATTIIQGATLRDGNGRVMPGLGDIQNSPYTQMPVFGRQEDKWVGANLPDVGHVVIDMNSWWSFPDNHQYNDTKVYKLAATMGG
jgi:hypothetical protein